MVYYKWYILPIGGLYATYHPLREPETTIEFISPKKDHEWKGSHSPRSGGTKKHTKGTIIWPLTTSTGSPWSSKWFPVTSPVVSSDFCAKPRPHFSPDVSSSPETAEERVAKIRNLGCSIAAKAFQQKKLGGTVGMVPLYNQPHIHLI